MVITNDVCWYGHVGGWLSTVFVGMVSVCWYGHVLLKWEDGYRKRVCWYGHRKQCLLVWSCVEVGGWLSPTVFVGMVMC